MIRSEPISKVSPAVEIHKSTRQERNKFNHDGPFLAPSGRRLGVECFLRQREPHLEEDDGDYDDHTASCLQVAHKGASPSDCVEFRGLLGPQPASKTLERRPEALL